MSVSLTYEASLWDAGAHVVAGVDEVGRGALAGPVTVGVCAVGRCDSWPEGLADSKELNHARRVAMADALGTFAGTGFGLARAVGHSSPAEIDAHGIIAALRLAGLRALAQIVDSGLTVDAVLLDGKHDWLTAPPATLFDNPALFDDPATASALPAKPLPPVTMVIKGDGLCASIAAGSVIAKVERDALMAAAHADHPEYGWESNKGYGAAGHLEAIRTLGPTPLHRRSWRLPV
ncbi:ribonuclease HII [Demequina sp. SO4-13]|uniref:ribonuclease HII n=1 Tax=Demequina sp. SO4-13 TaxID=3401027 RepID=UPI003AF53444